ncbi:hypothetical protein BH11BAC1_BH11BAC1_03460 [soil metagenome]
MRKVLCRIAGHRWKQKNNKNKMEDFHTIFLHGASRKCARCNKVQISYRNTEEADMYFI